MLNVNIQINLFVIILKQFIIMPFVELNLKLLN